MRAKHSALILTAGFLLLPTLSWSQFPGGGSDSGGRSRMTMMSPDRLFDQYSKDGRTLRKEDLPPQMQMGLERFGPMLGLTGSEWTREELKATTERLRERFIQGGGFSFRPSITGGDNRSSDGRDDRDRLDGREGRGFGDSDRITEEYFKRLDINEDGVLDFSELGVDRVTESLAAERDKYDTNENGWIEPGEFKAFMAARNAPQDSRGRDGDRNDRNGGRRRPTLIRAGNLPRDFPYSELDSDVDGQVGLYEWKNGGKRISEFLPMDLNNDGFLTYDEYSRYRRQENGESGTTQFGPGASNGQGALAMRGNNGGGFPGMGQRGAFPGMGDRASFPGMSGIPGRGGDYGGRFGDRGRGFSMGGDRGPGSFSIGDRGRGFGVPGGFPGMGDRGSRGPGGFGGPGTFGGDRSNGGPGSGMTPPSRFGGPRRGFSQGNNAGPTPPSTFGRSFGRPNGLGGENDERRGGPRGGDDRRR